MQTVTPPHLIRTNPCQTKTYHNNLLPLQLIPITNLHILPPMTTQQSNYMTTHLSKRYLQLLKLTSLLTDQDIHLKSNQTHFLRLLTEPLKLITI